MNPFMYSSMGRWMDYGWIGRSMERWIDHWWMDGFIQSSSHSSIHPLTSGVQTVYNDFALFLEARWATDPTIIVDSRMQTCGTLTIKVQGIMLSGGFYFVNETLSLFLTKGSHALLCITKGVVSSTCRSETHSLSLSLSLYLSLFGEGSGTLSSV